MAIIAIVATNGYVQSGGRRLVHHQLPGAEDRDALQGAPHPAVRLGPASVS